MKLKQKGFTLVELLIVVSAIALFSTIAFMSLGQVKTKSRDTQRVSNIAEFVKGLTLLASEGNAYPIAEVPICLDGDDIVNQALNAGNYTSQPLFDPLFPADASKCYRYQTNAEGTEYSITYSLETTSDAGSEGDNIIVN